MNGSLPSGAKVRHERFGHGRVEVDKGATVLVRFAHGYEECPRAELRHVISPAEAAQTGGWHRPLEVVLRVQAAAIRSLNDMWGVFSQARIDLYPHQLWVCRRVLAQWPVRWLVADDVGLGKTIEAGLMLSPLLARGRVRRLLVLCPAKLVEQWQYRLRTMFDIRLAQYTTDADTPKADFWGTHHAVVASFHTLREDHNGRHGRIFAAQPWDLLIVDEAHHLNHDEEAGMTSAYSLVKRLEEGRQVESMVFFTGTPHRGKNFGFYALLKLLRPDWFDPRRPTAEQIHRLRDCVIRNNKQNVTDIQGRRLFQEPVVSTRDYCYCPKEEAFYRILTEFITTGKAYASTLDSAMGSAVILVLIAMQKLASSSIAAIRKAIAGRLERLEEHRRNLELERDVARRNAGRTADQLEQAEAAGDLDEAAHLIEDVVEEWLELMANEEERLRELLAAADLVSTETKLVKLMEMLRGELTAKPVLLFTEYKATQTLILNALRREFGPDCAAFINGDDCAEGVLDGTGRAFAWRERREVSAEKFNGGRVRFLVTTEAGGEGIDLQENCHHLVHFDLPWNPMRLHQRVGRLNRLGQPHAVQVFILRNPDTVESLIWSKLNTKIMSVMNNLNVAMESPEDLMKLVLGMTSPSMFSELFADAGDVPRERLSEWFDQKTATFGGRGVLDTVRELVGQCARFDFAQAAPEIPRLDLPDLRPFFLNSLVWNGRRWKEEEDGRVSFKTPDAWQDERGVRALYEEMTFDRHDRRSASAGQVLGVGHPAVNRALRQAEGLDSCATLLPGDLLPRRMLVFVVSDRVTGRSSPVRHVVVGVESDSSGGHRLLHDWEVLTKLNQLDSPYALERRKSSEGVSPSLPPESCVSAALFVEAHLSELKLPFQMPSVEVFALFAVADAN
jgi:ERCC4-related helicase